MLLHEKIKVYIEKNGLKQIHIACKSGFNIKTFNAMLNGNRKLLADEFLEICQKGLNEDPRIFFDNTFQENGKSA